jgi:hypothetical protein
MPDLSIRIKKKTDGSAALSCTRADGSTTWQRQDGQLGRFFPLHDLTHYAVETVLGIRQGFYGLIAQGWDITRFSESGVSSQLPEDALLAEVLVGFFDTERASGTRATAEDFNWKIRTYYDEHATPTPTFRMTDDTLDRIRATRADLFARWHAVEPGDALELSFER